MSVVEADVAVLGLGVHGSAAAASLSRRGQRVVALDRFGAGHGRGSSHGRTRMIRRAYPAAVWNGFVDAAYDAWRALERETGRTLIRRTGGVYAHAGASQLQGPGVESLPDAAAVADRMPALRIPEGYRAVYDPDAGVLEAAEAIAALRETALSHGARLRFGERVTGWDLVGSRVEVRAEAGTIRADRLVVAAGAFAGALVPALARSLEVWRILTLTVAAGQPAGMPPGLGAFSIDRPEGLVFGIPDAAGNGLKIGVDAGEVWDPEVPVAEPTDAEVAHLRTLMERYVPGIDTRDVEAAACLYTMTEDRRFTIGTLADAPEVVLAAPCSGHGFKFGAAVGDAVADLCAGVPRPDLEFVSTARRGL
ncbi:N-methyl-L-tryptophan oxidase [Microbacterium sp. SORGH_AS_0888]|uniref:N-methyl-L-tryptophan oxidase n=1 Tax=Microbacterium sp. SORGH_AS_0888 TaxID=3041791 RepID=UPI0027849515|nr:N-methyl-L-tryptophan oxidase [Microbacterium sp. SORGH_AS_0888]MDQ1129321.1 monomeric sarcosine oxidase [Microbacterium sp. SORGH_AS_0888]